MAKRPSCRRTRWRSSRDGPFARLDVPAPTPPEFGFADAAGVVPYLARLGVSHLYLSPVFEAVGRSTHGYDPVDYGRVRAGLGGDDAFTALIETAHEHGLGIVLDIVPHHMAAVAENAWWWSVLAR